MPPLRRILAHCLHEHESALVHQVVRSPETADGYVIGEVDEAGLRRLREAGILVQFLDGERRAPLRRRAVRMAAAAPPADVRPAGAAARAAPAWTPAPNTPVLHRVLLAGPLLAAWRRQLEAAGAEIRDALPDGGVTVLMPQAAAVQVGALPFVTGVEPGGAHADEPEPSGLAPAPPGGAMRVITYDVLLVDQRFLADVRQWLEQRHVLVTAAARDKLRLLVPDDTPVIADLRARRDWVGDIEVYEPPQLHNDVARRILGLDPAAPQPAFPFAGAGQVVAVADTGIDVNHPDLAGRLAHVIALGRPNDPSDPHGHGTHVAGSIAGDGAASGGTVRGVAPAATLVFQSLLDAGGGLGGLPFRLEDLFDQAYQLGARIHNNSWGAATRSTYRVSSREVDAFVDAHRDMLIVISAGNEGTAADPQIGVRNAQPGFVDWLSVGSPATCKNALTVGASRNERVAGGYSQLTYGAAWPQDFPAPPIATETVSGDPDRLSGFSSRGPCDDYRVKPDVIAPGTDILSCRSALAPLWRFWGPDLQNRPEYAFMGGTSMAAPLVAGCAALVREYYEIQRNHQPSAALLKATLINGTRRLPGPDAVADHPALPNYHQGFGAVYLPTTIPSPVAPGLRLEFVDLWQQPADHFVTPGQFHRYDLVVGGGAEVRLCLAFTDRPANGPQNNLNMIVETPAGGPKLFGNMQLPMGFNQPDPTNNVEILRIPNAAAGTYLIQIVAYNLLAPQDYALVATGPIVSLRRRP
jgi:subtilisin family serine protease